MPKWLCTILCGIRVIPGISSGFFSVYKYGLGIIVQVSLRHASPPLLAAMVNKRSYAKYWMATVPGRVSKAVTDFTTYSLWWYDEEQDKSYLFMVFSQQMRGRSMWRLLGDDAQIEVVQKKEEGYKEVVKQFIGLEGYEQKGTIPGKCRPSGFEEPINCIADAVESYARSRMVSKKEYKPLSVYDKTVEQEWCEYKREHPFVRTLSRPCNK